VTVDGIREFPTRRTSTDQRIAFGRVVISCFYTLQHSVSSGLLILAHRLSSAKLCVFYKSADVERAQKRPNSKARVPNGTTSYSIQPLDAFAFTVIIL
jgi:hypothetical protein